MIPEPGFQKPRPYYEKQRVSTCVEHEGISRQQVGTLGKIRNEVTITHLRGGSRKEVVDLLIDVNGTSQVLDTTSLGLNEMVTVDGGRNGCSVHAGGHELQESHLGGGILARNSLWVMVRSYADGSMYGCGIAYVRAELEVARPASDVLVFGVVKMAVENLLGEGERAVQAKEV
jgi:hypothetical protein